ncbi:MAG TPA: tRNA epoxyqueuosine(34) reductase QueG [Gemmatimonadaceae bacterium]|nr:tRNA epoxyqueuosine(34) reductase QueG [Gemmatimonadaceae bacterium]
MTGRATVPAEPAEAALEHRLKAHAYGLGFDRAGIARLGPAPTADHLGRWLERGFAGEMGYMARWQGERGDTRLPFPGARSAIVVTLDYGGRQPSGRIARYARGRDYHAVMRQRLRELHRWLEGETGGPIAGRAYVDTGPILERDLARRAGLGWFGKNANLISPRTGSFFFIGALFLDLDLVPDAPFDADRCGSCTRCMDACPTGAIPEPRVVDSTRCISYLTIELRGSIPESLRPGVGEHVVGCDICQDVCPWNVRFAREPRDPDLTSTDPEPSLSTLLALTNEEFRRRFGHSAVTRTGRRGLARNAAVAMGNRGDPSDVPALTRALSSDPEPVVRGHVAWALGRFQTDAAREALHRAAATECDPSVRAEIASASEAHESARTAT